MLAIGINASSNIGLKIGSLLGIAGNDGEQRERCMPLKPCPVRSRQKAQITAAFSSKVKVVKQVMVVVSLSPQAVVQVINNR